MPLLFYIFVISWRLCTDG